MDFSIVLSTKCWLAGLWRMRHSGLKGPSEAGTTRSRLLSGKWMAFDHSAQESPLQPGTRSPSWFCPHDKVVVWGEMTLLAVVNYQEGNQGIFPGGLL